MPNSTADIFSKEAHNYDAVFTNSGVGKVQREKVYYHLHKSKSLNNCNGILELNCGTGEDACYFTEKGYNVVATDISQGMVDTAQTKLGGRSMAKKLSASDAVEGYSPHEQSLIFSNFGGLNCMAPNQLVDLISKAAQVQEKGQKIAWVLMPRKCFMENNYFFFRGKWKSIGRRNTKGALAVNVNGAAVKTWYYSPSYVKQHLKLLGYDVNYVKPVAFFVPPSYLASKFKTGSVLLGIAKALDRLACSFSFLSGNSDHFVICATRK